MIADPLAPVRLAAGRLVERGLDHDAAEGVMLDNLDRWPDVDADDVMRVLDAAYGR